MKPKNITTRGVKVVRVIRNTGPGGFSLAELSDNHERTFGVRWNGEEGENGYPTSRGYPVWFTLPGEMADPLVSYYRGITNTTGVELDVEADDDDDNLVSAEG